MNEIYDYSVFIGRFQPLHEGHLSTIRKALNLSKKLIIIIGSYKCAPSTRQPWTATERIKMIQACLSKQEQKRVLFIPIRDRLYSDSIWKQNILNEIKKLTPNNSKITLIGHNKDSSSYYLTHFPDWQFIETGNYKNINSTDFRKKYFSEEKANFKFIPKSVESILTQFKKTSIYKKLKEEYLFVDSVRKKLNGNSFTVCNSLVVCGNYLLLVRRKKHPGKNLVALPGGHLEQNEELEQCAIRELFEETNIKVTIEELKTCFVSKFYCDYPERSPITRSFAHIFYYSLPHILCPHVTPGDDANEAFWCLFDELSFLEDQFFADHYQVLQLMLGRVKEIHNNFRILGAALTLP